MLQIYDTVTQKKAVFKPIVAGQVGLYVCGITVYDYSHIGHARAYLAFDVILRYLRSSGYQVRYIRNVTDIDDKIIKRAQDNNESWQQLADRFMKSMHEDFEQLNLVMPEQEPKATHFIPEMIELIQILMEKGYAYPASNGDVYYDIEKFEQYGCLSHRHIDDLRAGARIDVNEAKRNPLDFVLWKRAKSGEPAWPSPWGLGRPGWHIECSAMAIKNLGETFDIHGGGPDLQFPHHENERAQSEAATGKPFANTWMHVGCLQIDKEKMSKSAGNFLTIRDFLKDYHPEVLRYFSIASHYRSPVDYTERNIDSAIAGMERLYTALRGLSEAQRSDESTDFEQRFRRAMDDDFNTPVALSILFELVREIHRTRDIDPTRAAMWGTLLKKLANILGLLYEVPETFLQNMVRTNLDVEAIEARIMERTAARNAKDWALSDRIRDELLREGILLDDTPHGTQWRRERVISA